MKNWFRIGVLSLALINSAAQAQSSADGSNFTASGSDENVDLQFTNSRFSIGVGVDTEFDVVGEITGVLFENYTSSLIGQGWVGTEGAGGLKLNYHWLINGVYDGEDDNGNPVYTDGTVLKSFLAVDQGEISQHRKLTFGGGFEKQHYFFSLYGSAGLSDEVLVNTFANSFNQVVTGVIDGRGFTRNDTVNTTTDVFEEVYEWGVGLRAGMNFEPSQLRLTLGGDYEDGNDGADQVTASVRLDKVFGDTGHMLSLRGAWARKSGPFEIDRTDWRGGIFYTFHFGQTHRPAQRFRQEEFTVIPPPVEKTEVFLNQVDVSSAANFELDESDLMPNAEEVLTDLLSRAQAAKIIGKIKITGHTCNLGPAEYNLGLSESRAKEVAQFFIESGLSEDQVEVVWKGEAEPRYSNDTEETRRLNRRVEVEFVTEERVERVVTSQEEPITEWRQVAVPTEAPWIRRALRTPVRHKRRVDVYRTEESSTEIVEGEVIFDNNPPEAVDDIFDLQQDSSDNVLNVLANDSDPDGDSLNIIDISTPSNGSAVINGNEIIYTPAVGFTGTDSFSYMIDDGFGGQQSAQVNISIAATPPPNQAPAAADDSAEVDSGESVLISVLDNDSDPEGEALVIINVSSPVAGLAEIVGQQISYTAPSDFSGTDTFSYTIADPAGNQSTATVTVVVNEVDTTVDNQPPIAVDDTAMAMGANPISIDVLANDSDPENDALTVVSISQPGAGTRVLELNADGTITFQADFMFMGMTSFTYTIEDTAGNSATATVMVMIGAD